MLIVKRKSELARFAIFLLLTGLMGYYVAAKADIWRASRRGSDPTAVNGGAPDGPLSGASSGPAALAGSVPPGGEAPGTAGDDWSDYFAEVRMGRERSRGALRETLREIMESDSADADTRKEAAQQFLATGRVASLENQVEALVKARGFDDAVVHLVEGTAQVVVRGASLSEQQFMQVVDLVSRITGTRASAVQVLVRNR